MVCGVAVIRRRDGGSSRRAAVVYSPRAPAPLDGYSRALPENAKHAGDRIRDRAVLAAIIESVW